MVQLAKEQTGDPRDQPQFDFRQRPTRQRSALPAPTQQPVDDRVENRRVDVEDQVAFQRLGLHQIETGGILQAEDELAVRELIDAGQLDFDNAPQQGRQRSAEVSPEPLVERLQRPHLFLADALRTLEVVGGDLLLGLAHREAGGRSARDGRLRLRSRRRRVGGCFLGPRRHRA